MGKDNGLLIAAALAVGAYFFFTRPASAASGGVYEVSPQIKQGTEAAGVKDTPTQAPTLREQRIAENVVSRAVNTINAGGGSKSISAQAQSSYIQSVLKNPVSVATIGKLKSVAVSPTSTLRL